MGPGDRVVLLKDQMFINAGTKGVVKERGMFGNGGHFLVRFDNGSTELIRETDLRKT